MDYVKQKDANPVDAKQTEIANYCHKGLILIQPLEYVNNQLSSEIIVSSVCRILE